MASIKVLLPDMPSNSKFHQVRVKVVSKTLPTQTPRKMRFQRIMLRDEAGNTMRMTTFGDDVGVYDQIFVVDKFYDILNVTVKEERPGSPYARGKVMCVTGSSVVKPVDISSDDGLFQCQFKTIADALAMESMDQVFNLACVIADTVATVAQHTHSGALVDMAKFRVTDDTYSDIVDVTLWGTLSTFVDMFRKNRHAQKVITIEGLRKSTFGGKITFTNAVGCSVNMEPDCNRSNELKAWYRVHQKDVEALLGMTEQVEPDVPPEEVDSISVCLQKKANEVKVGHTVQFVANIDDFADSSVRTSTGCNRCGRAANFPIGHRYLCPSCNRPTTCVAKLYFDFTVRDATASLSLNAQTRAVERILGITAHAYYMGSIEASCGSNNASTSRPSTARNATRVLKGLGRVHVPPRPLAMKGNTRCLHCCAVLLPYEPLGMCCCNGEVVLAPVFNSDILSDLFTRDDANGLHFRQYCRLYNNFFGFSSLGGNIKTQTSDGVHTISLLGQLYHFLPSVRPVGEERSYLQMYFYDGMHEASLRYTLINDLVKLNQEVMDLLMRVTYGNPYARFFRTIKLSDVTCDYRIRISKNPILDPTVYNAPTTDEVAAILVGDDDVNSFNSPHIVVHAHDNESYRVMHYYGCYDPLQYPLLFTRGESGWFHGIPRGRRRSGNNNDNVSFPISNTTVQTAADLFVAESYGASTSRSSTRVVSCREFYAYRFQIRSVRSVLNTTRIFLQYGVDMYIKVENTRIDFIRKNQKLLRAELYQGIVDSFNDGICSAASIGKKVILPPSFIGGPRDVKQRYLNAMALVQRFGRPDLFITMTCNPKWPEITDLLLPTEIAQDRPDVVARVFHSKLTLLKEELFKKCIFGTVAARIDVIEFQKRGLPHVHILIILEGSSKIVNPAMYDQYVSAELPSADEPQLRALVVKHMVHGPYGTINPRCGCMKDKNGISKCRFGYPKQFAEETTCGPDSYPIYRRRQDGSSVTVRGHCMDNRWIVPYNPYLLAAFDCHINVEICSTIKAVKYLYKYVYKGHDRICFNVERAQTVIVDEPQAFQTGRWISPPEALWRIYKFKLFDISPPVLPLQLHLPDMQSTCFPANCDLSTIVNSNSRSNTMLTAYFKANVQIPEAKNHYYTSFPEWFVWNKGKKAWTLRSKQVSIGRLVYAAPDEGERYYLRILLCNLRGATSFENLRTVQGVVHPTFKSACEASGFLHADDYADQCMDEAVPMAMPHVLRRLFATLLHFVEGVDSRHLWNKYFVHLSEDYAHTYQGDKNRVEALTYGSIERFLESAGKSISNYDIPVPVASSYAHMRITRDITDAVYGSIPEDLVDASDRLNLGQRAAYDAIMDSVMRGEPKAFFIDGPGGTGKTFLYCALLVSVRALGKIVLPTATSGIAASNIPTGRTAHSRFKIPLDGSAGKTCAVSKQSALASLLREASLIIWDEASMAKCDDVESIDSMLQDVCDSTCLFGGKTIVFGGDFRQILPVVRNSSLDDIVAAILINSHVWPNLVKFHLTENIRAQRDPCFARFLLDLGSGNMQNKTYSSVHLPDELVDCQLLREDDNWRMIQSVFPEIGTTECNSAHFSDRAILCPTNEGVDLINEEIIGRFPGDAVTYTASDSLINEDSNVCTPEFLSTLTPSGMSPYKLTLKQNCPVILLRNLDPAHGLCNGTRLLCTGFNRNTISCKISSGYYAGEEVFLPRILLRPPSKGHGPFEFQRRQFPIKLCFAMTINKSQGQTLERVALYLRESCFTHGQLYVACSRARHRKGLTVYATHASVTTESPNDVTNVISYDVLRRSGII